MDTGFISNFRTYWLCVIYSIKVRNIYLRFHLAAFSYKKHRSLSLIKQFWNSYFINCNRVRVNFCLFCNKVRVKCGVDITLGIWKTVFSKQFTCAYFFNEYRCMRSFFSNCTCFSWKKLPEKDVIVKYSSVRFSNQCTSAIYQKSLEQK